MSYDQLNEKINCMIKLIYNLQIDVFSIKTKINKINEKIEYIKNPHMSFWEVKNVAPYMEKLTLEDKFNKVLIELKNKIPIK